MEICSNNPTQREYNVDQNRLRRLAICLKKKLDLELHTSDATCWGDRWRIPITFATTGAISVDEKYFSQVRKAGGRLLVEESFDENQMNSYFVEISRTHLCGFYAWPTAERYIFVFCLCALLVSTYQLYHHVDDFFRAQ